MAQQLQEPQPEKHQTRKLRSWVPWTVALVVLGAILVFAISVLFILKSQGINQRTVIILTVLSIIVGTIVALLGLLFTFLQWFHSRPPHPSDLMPPSTVPRHEEVTNNVSLSKSIPGDMHQEDWGEAPHIEQFYGREHEQAELKQWIVDDHCRMVAVLGIGGIGKTSLIAVITEQVKDAFDSVFWRSLQNAPPLESILQSCIQFLSHQQQFDLPQDVDGQITLLIQYLRDHRCLVVFDNFETVLQAGDRVGQYQEGYEGYGKLLQRVGEVKHQSCLLLTSREKPKEIAFMEGNLSLVRSRELEGLKSIDGREILKDKGLRGEEKNWESLVLRYEGNPLALKIVAQFIREVFDGDIAGFLQTGEAMFSTIRYVLEQQFGRLSALERAMMYWLAIEREAVSLDELDEDLVHPGSRRAILEAIVSLRRRSMIETSGVAHFTQQPVIMEYVIEELVGQVYQEIDTGKIELLASHALMKAQAKDYVRDSQIHLILAPVAERLLTTCGKEGSEEKLKNILTLLRETYPQTPGYAAGNVLNLLIQLQCDLRGYDFSHLAVWQAYLRRVMLPEVNFTRANFDKSVFTETFGSVLSVAFSRNGEMLAAGTATGEIRLWQVSGITPLFACRGHNSWVRSIAFNSNGSIFISGSDDMTVRVWDSDTGQCLRVLLGHSNLVRAVAYSSVGNVIASGSEDQSIRLWNADTGECLHILQGHRGWVMTVAFSPDGNILASGGEDQTIRLWNVDTGECLKTFLGHTHWRIRSVVFSPDGNILASGGEDQTINLWNVDTGECFKTFHGHTHSRIRSVAFSFDGKLIASGGDDRTIRIWEVSTGQCLKILQGHTNVVWSVAFSSNDNIVASGSEDQTVRLWEIDTGHCLISLQGYHNWIRSVAFHPDGNLIASVGSAQVIHIWEVSTGRCLRTLQGFNAEVGSVTFSPDGTTIAGGSEDHSIRIWEVDNAECLQILLGHRGWIRSVAYSVDGGMLASGSYDQTIRLWDVTTGQCLKILQGHVNRVWSVGFSPDGKRLASGGDDLTIRFWEISTGQCLKTLHGHSNRVYSVKFSPDGKMLASSSADQTVRLWEIKTGQCLKILQGHSSTVWAITFSLDGRMVASCSDDQTVRLWEVSTGRCLKILQGHTGQIWSVAFSPNGRILASGSNDGTIKFWDFQTGEYLRILKSDRPYEHMNITGVRGLTDAQKATLKALGAVEDEMRALS